MLPQRRVNRARARRYLVRRRRPPTTDHLGSGAVRRAGTALKAENASRIPASGRSNKRCNGRDPHFRQLEPTDQLVAQCPSAPERRLVRVQRGEPHLEFRTYQLRSSMTCYSGARVLARYREGVGRSMRSARLAGRTTRARLRRASQATSLRATVRRAPCLRRGYRSTPPRSTINSSKAPPPAAQLASESLRVESTLIMPRVGWRQELCEGNLNVTRRALTDINGSPHRRHRRTAALRHQRTHRRGAVLSSMLDDVVQRQGLLHGQSGLTAAAMTGRRAARPPALPRTRMSVTSGAAVAGAAA